MYNEISLKWSSTTESLVEVARASIKEGTMAKKTVTVTSDGKGRYRVPIVVAGVAKKATLDTGYTGTGGGGACSVNKDNWDKIKAKLTKKGKGGKSKDYKGKVVTTEYGKAKIKIDGLDTEVEKYISYSGGANDLIGITFIHNLGAAGISLAWDFKTRTMVFTEPEKEDEEEEDKKKVEEENNSLEEELTQNRAFYEGRKEYIQDKFAGMYVVIAHGELIRVLDTYDQAIEVAEEIETEFPGVMVFRGDEEPYFGTEEHRLGDSEIDVDA